jgi:hypothetical protein
MDTFTLPARTLTVLCSPAAAPEPVVELLAMLALRGPVTVLDGGNCFPAYRLARTIASQAPDLAAVMQRVFVCRAFTCHQMLSLLEGAPSLPQACLLLDPLATFYDDQVPEQEVRRLLAGCLRQMKRLAQKAPVLITLPPPRTKERAFLARQVCECASQLYTFEMPEAPPQQPALFPLALKADRR